MFFNKNTAKHDKILLISAPNFYGGSQRPLGAVPLLAEQLKAAGFNPV